MAVAKMTGLGRGLDSIFIENTAPGEGVTMLRISNIEPRAGQPRKKFDEAQLAALADSIKTHGVIQPIAVREGIGGFYEIIAGERRWRAAKLAGLSEMPVVILSADDKKTDELALVENMQREDLNPIEEARAYREMADKYGYTQDDIAKAVGKSRPAIANTMRLLDAPGQILSQVESGKLSEGQARALLPLKESKYLSDVIERVIAEEMSVRDCEKLVRKIKKTENAPEEEDNGGEVDYNAVLENKVSRKLGRKVRIVGDGAKKRVELYFEDQADMENIIRGLCGNNIFED